MIKYKVKDVATDFGVQNKKITEVLEKFCGVSKKAGTSLEENELNVIFDVLTAENKVDSFDKYFAKRNEAIENAEAQTTEVKEEKKPEAKEAKAPKTNKTDKKPEKANNNQKSEKPAEQAQPAKQDDKQPEQHSRKRRVIDTRATNIDVERYNSKYDDMASDSSKNRTNDNTMKKQKFANRSQKQKGRRHGKRETEAERLKRIALERKQKPITVQIPEEIVVSELALRLKATVAEVVKKAFLMGTMITATDTIDFDTASLIAMEFHAKVEKEVVVTIEERLIDDSEDDDANLVGRAPVVVVMGHVDHGKTSILDAIRHANVTAGEAGGITQHIGAYRVQVNGKPITFLDTPGHEAFTTMRARGAQVTDIAILVVAADDGIMPQTVEAINHAKAAGVSVIVAINKMDKVGANPEQVKQQLTEYELIPEEWGGDTPCIPVSAKTKEGLDDLLEMVALVAEMKELKANPDRAAKGTVIEARLDKGRGPVATVLVQNGTLHKGDIIIAGTTVGRVRVMTNDKGERVQEAGPSVPVEITGLDEVPTGGDVFDAVSDERLARTLVDQRKAAKKEEIFSAQTKVTLDNLFDQLKQGEVQELQIIVKADVQGSVEAVRQSLEKLSNDEVRVNVIHGAVGAINESDVMLAEASSAIIVGFNVRPDAVALDHAERSGVDMRLYSVIYDCINEIEAAMKGMLAPKTREVVLGMAECRNVIKIKSVGTIAGSYVKSGKIQRGGGVRVIRDGIVIAEDHIGSLQRFKDAVKEVNEGYECGIGLEKFNDLKEGDMFEVYTIEEYRD
ncbi:MAG: translation initiation factor IF-2 [Ruminococcus sp.]|nr:translation initiation factor IF-2 [Ruminococcus sp.]MEE0856242.1 translation initiation factor IF-2 [Ruminococcus sp.]